MPQVELNELFSVMEPVTLANLKYDCYDIEVIQVSSTKFTGKLVVNDFRKNIIEKIDKHVETLSKEDRDLFIRVWEDLTLQW